MLTSLFRLILLLSLLGILAPAATPARAAPVAEVEPNNTNATAQSLAAIGVDNQVNAAIDVGADRDWFRFEAIAGRNYVIDVFNAASSLGGQGYGCTGGGMNFGEAGLGLWVYTSTGTQLLGECDAVAHSAGNSHHLATIPATVTGTLYVMVIANDPNATGFYSLRIMPKYNQPGASHGADQEPNDTLSSAYPLTVGYTNGITSDIALRNPAYSTYRADHDWYVFDAIAGRTYVAELFNVSTGLSASGLNCTSKGNTGGSGMGLLFYSPTELELAGECSAIGFSQAAGNYHHMVKITASVSGPLFMKVLPNDSNAAGAYSLRVLPKYDEPGAGWDSSSFEPNNTIWNAYAITVGDSAGLTSEIELRNPIYSTFYPDKDWYRFTASAGQTYSIELFNVASELLASGLSCSSDGVTGGSGLSLLVYNPAEVKVAGECSASGKGNGAIHHQLQFVSSVSGQYHILVAPNANAAGSYSLRVCTTAAAGCGSIPTPTTATPTATKMPTATPIPTATTVTPPPDSPSWLVLLYLAGDDVVPNTQTPTAFSYAVSEALFRLRRMPVNPAIQLMVLYDGPNDGDSRIYMQRSTGFEDVTEKAVTSPIWTGAVSGTPGQRELNSGSLVTLGNFIDWARANARPTRYTMLSIVDHGGGWAPDFNDPPGQPRGIGRVQAGGWRGMSLDMHSGGDSLSTRDIGKVFEGVEPFDVLFYDACLMGMIETAYEVRNAADYLVAGENTLFAQLPYEQYLNAASLSAATTPEQLAKNLVHQYNIGIDSRWAPFTIAALDLRQLRANLPNNLAQRVNRLAELLLEALPASPTSSDALVQVLMASYSASQKFDYDNSLTLDPQEGYVDLVDFADNLSKSDKPGLTQPIRDAARAIVQSASDTSPGNTPVIIDHRRISGRYGNDEWNLEQARGLSIFLPLGERDERPTRVQLDGQLAISEPQLPYYADPAQLAFSRDAPAWSKFLQRLEPVVVSQRTGQAIERRVFRIPTQQFAPQLLFLPAVMR